MKRQYLLIAIMGLLGGLLFTAGVLALSPIGFDLGWHVLGGGGAPMSSTNFVANSTTGQTAIGASTSANFRLEAGYWYGAGAAPGLRRLYVPLLLKQSP